MTIIITSVNYSDYLNVTLPKWEAAFPDENVRVLTSWQDHETIAINGGHRVFCTDKFQIEGSFNRASALDDCLSQIAEGSIVASVDADVIPHGKLPANIEFDTIYGCARYTEAGNIIHPWNRRKPWRTPEECASRCLGFFQLFRYSKTRKFGSYPTAGKYDTDFVRLSTRYLNAHTPSDTISSTALLTPLHLV